MVTKLIKQKDVRKRFNEVFAKVTIENVVNSDILGDYNAPLVGNALDYFISCHFNYLNKNHTDSFTQHAKRYIKELKQTHYYSFQYFNKKTLKEVKQVFYKNKVLCSSKGSPLFEKRTRLPLPTKTFFCYKPTMPDFHSLNGAPVYGVLDGSKEDVDYNARWRRSEIIYNYSTGEIGVLIEKALAKYQAYKKNGKITPDFLKAILILAQIMPGIHIQRLSKDLGKPIRDEDISILERLIKKMPNGFFRSKNVLINPSLRLGTITGEPDYIIDDIILDIKTTKSFFSRIDFNQLICYYLLYKINEKYWNKVGVKINKIGIYYALHGQLIQFDVTKLCSPSDLKEILQLIEDKSYDTSYY